MIASIEKLHDNKFKFLSVSLINHPLKLDKNKNEEKRIYFIVFE